MLVLSRRNEESIDIDGPARIRVLGAEGGRVRLGIEAERSVTILRTELLQQPQDAAAVTDGSGVARCV